MTNSPAGAIAVTSRTCWSRKRAAPTAPALNSAWPCWTWIFFKRVNDTYDHQAGDKVLITFAQVAQKGLRRNDYFGRYGGEEFMLIMSDTEMAGAKVQAERLRANVGKTRFPEIDPKLVQTVSIGIAEFRRGESIEQIEQRADRALYKAKSNGRNRVETDTEAR